MIIAPMSWNLLASATLSSAANLSARGYPASNLWDADPLKPWLSSGPIVVEVGVNDASDFDDGGGALAATVAAGTYRTPMELAQAIATAHRAVGASTWRGYWDQATNQIVLLKTSGTATLLVSSGAGTATNCLRLLGGYRNQDRTAAASHTGDFGVIHGPAADVVVDLGATYGAGCGFVVGLRTGLGAHVEVQVGSTTATSDASYLATDRAARGVTYIPMATVTQARYARLRIADPRRTDASRVGAGYWYHGPMLDTDSAEIADPANYETASYSRSVVSRCVTRSTVDRHTKVSERAPVERIGVSFSTQPGMGHGLAPAVEELLAGLSVDDMVLVALDPTGEPHRESFLGRLVARPAVTRLPFGGRSGRWSIGLEFESVEVDA